VRFRNEISDADRARARELAVRLGLITEGDAS
jgi:hypothetical protein